MASSPDIGSLVSGGEVPGAPMAGNPDGASADELKPRYTVKHSLAVIGVLASSSESTGRRGPRSGAGSPRQGRGSVGTTPLARSLMGRWRRRRPASTNHSPVDFNANLL